MDTNGIALVVSHLFLTNHPLPFSTRCVLKRNTTRERITQVRCMRLKFHFETTRRSLVRMERHDTKPKIESGLSESVQSLERTGFEDWYTQRSENSRIANVSTLVFGAFKIIPVFVKSLSLLTTPPELRARRSESAVQSNRLSETGYEILMLWGHLPKVRDALHFQLLQVLQVSILNVISISKLRKFSVFPLFLILIMLQPFSFASSHAVSFRYLCIVYIYIFYFCM